MANRTSRFAYRTLSTLLAIPISRLVTSVVRQAWIAARPDNPPHDPNAGDAKWTDSVIFALLTGVGAATTELMITKGSETVWRAVTGMPTPPRRPRRGRIVRRNARPHFRAEAVAAPPTGQKRTTRNDQDADAG
jgi:hypothetical protein